ncbi:MAG: hypothetical protein HQ517_06710 [SAR324 cluster bacterium]|nr:hypothetical protein [SAR324 cluster bacterium]
MAIPGKQLKKYFFGILSLVLLNASLAFGEEDGKKTLFQRSDPKNFETVQQLQDPREILQQFPPFTTVERIPYLQDVGYYPCTDCHGEEQPPNVKIRLLEEDHEDIKLVHGLGRFWCLTCHSAANRDVLTSLKNQPISFNDAYLLCGQCHFQRQRDFFAGGHGKRKDQWQGERVLYNCTECHNPHVPQIGPRKPVAIPKIRPGIKQSVPLLHQPPKPWVQAHE